MKELVNAISQASANRLKQPFFGSFILGWIAVNHTLVIEFIFSKSEQKIELVKNSGFDKYSDLVYPLLVAVLYTFALPLIQRWIDKAKYKLVDKPRIDDKHKVQKNEYDARMLSSKSQAEVSLEYWQSKLTRDLDTWDEEREKLKNKITDKDDELVNIQNNHRTETNNLNIQIKELQNQIQQLQNQRQELQNKIKDEIEKLNLADEQLKTTQLELENKSTELSTSESNRSLLDILLSNIVEKNEKNKDIVHNAIINLNERGREKILTNEFAFLDNFNEEQLQMIRDKIAISRSSNSKISNKQLLNKLEQEQNNKNVKAWIAETFDLSDLIQTNKEDISSIFYIIKVMLSKSKVHYSEIDTNEYEENESISRSLGTLLREGYLYLNGTKQHPNVYSISDKAIEELSDVLMEKYDN